MKSKSINLDGGMNNIGLKFEAKAEDGAKARDEKKIMLGATAKYTLKAFADSVNFEGLATTINSKLEVEGKATFNSMTSILTVGQKATAGTEWKAAISNFPAALTLSTIAYGSIDTLSSEENITLKYGAEGSATIKFDPFSAAITVLGGYGYSANFTTDSEVASITSSVGVKLALPIAKRWTIFGQASLVNTAPLSGEFSKSQVGTDTRIECGVTFK